MRELFFELLFEIGIIGDDVEEIPSLALKNCVLHFHLLAYIRIRDPDGVFMEDGMYATDYLSNFTRNQLRDLCRLRHIKYGKMIKKAMAEALAQDDNTRYEKRVDPYHFEIDLPEVEITPQPNQDPWSLQVEDLNCGEGILIRLTNSNLRKSSVMDALALLEQALLEEDA